MNKNEPTYVDGYADGVDYIIIYYIEEPFKTNR